MNLEQTTELYASVLRQLLPEGVYDTAEMTHVADDIYAHAKALAQADIDAHRLLQVLEKIPVDLLADYEREYGLPMQCMVPGSQTIEERISVLRWIRQHRNVMNREYLEQILAIFGVTLVDAVKHYPMLCTAPCTSPVNTERLRYKVLLRLQYPMTADMSCIIENYLPGYLRVEWVVDMPWGEWILNAGYELSGDNIRYIAYKTNQRDFYESFANFDLVTALVRSFQDTDMQKWQGFKDAVEGLTGVTSWVIDTINEQVKYVGIINNCSDGSLCPTYPKLYKIDMDDGSGSAYFTTGAKACSFWKDSSPSEYINTANVSYSGGTCYLTGGTANYNNLAMRSVFYENNPNYNPNNLPNYSFIGFQTIALKIISNASFGTPGIALFAESYLENVAQSIFNQDKAKQFVKLSDLISQFELNKTLRT